MRVYTDALLLALPYRYKSQIRSTPGSAATILTSWAEFGKARLIGLIGPAFLGKVSFVVSMFLGAALGAVIIHYSISAALGLGTAISAVCSAALFRSVRTSDRL